MSNAVAQQMKTDPGISVPKPRPAYGTYRSPYAPQYKVRRNFHGIDAVKLQRFGIAAGMFGGVGIFALIFFTAGVPRVRIDILQRVPIIGPYFVREIPPEDDPF